MRTLALTLASALVLFSTAAHANTEDDRVNAAYERLTAGIRSHGGLVPPDNNAIVMRAKACPNGQPGAIIYRVYPNGRIEIQVSTCPQ